MNTDMQKFCDELRAKISIVDVVGAKVKLVRKGREYQACCPFHNEKTPSFTVNEAKGFYHCFGCGAHGDIIKFEMEANGLTFMEAVEKLAHKIGLEVPRMTRESKEQIEKRKNAYEILEIAVKYFEKELRMPDGREGLNYLYGRGFDDEIITKFRLGYAPANNGLKAQLSAQGVSDKEMAELGLITIPEERRPHDFFRNRVMIPIMDKAGRVIAFGGRVMDKSQPKYLNSPETPVFNKRRILYNMNNAREAGYDAKKLIICEGYMDVIAMYKYGIGYAVAPLGTALTEDQIGEAWKVVAEPTCCFDGDNAGIGAAMRSTDRVLPILKAGYSLQYAFLPDRQDPDEFLKAHGKEEFLQMMSDTVPLKDLLWRKNYQAQEVNTPEQKALLEKKIKEEVAKISDDTVREYYVQEMKGKLYNEIGVGAWKRKNYYQERNNQYQERGHQYQNNGGQNSRSRYNKANTGYHQPRVSIVAGIKTNLDDLVAQYVVSALYLYPQLIEEYAEKLLDFEIKSEKLKRIYDTMLDLVNDEQDFADSEALGKALAERGLGEDIDKFIEIKMLAHQCPDIVKMRKALDNRIIEVQVKLLDNEIRDASAEIEKSDSPEQAFERFMALKKERDLLIKSSDQE